MNKEKDKQEEAAVLENLIMMVSLIFENDDELGEEDD